MTAVEARAEPIEVVVQLELDDLPNGWTLAKLGQLAHYLNGRAFDKDEWGKEGRPIIRIQNLTRSSGTVNRFLGNVEDRYIVRDGELLISWAATLGAFIYRGEEAVLNQHIFKVVPFIDKKFLFYLADWSLKWLMAETHGSGMVHITKGKFDDFPILLPPLEEQRRIVAKLEALFSKLEAGVTALQRAKALLKRYRQSLLRDAVEGKLSADWRAKQTNLLEPASALLERVLGERREAWEARELAKLRAKGMEPLGDAWKARYEEPSAVDASSLPELPAGWVRVETKMLMSSIRSGSSAVPTRNKTDFPVLRSSSVRHGKIDFDDVRYLSFESSENPENFLEVGDVLFTRLNGSLDYVGNCAVVDILDAKVYQYPDRLFCLKLANPAHAEWLELFFESKQARTRIEQVAKSTAGHQRISTDAITEMPVPLPPLEEQLFIVAELERRFELLDSLESTLESELKRAAQLRQSALHRAFTGRLVPQDPTDEPASVLLERIRAARAAAPAKRGRNAAQVKPVPDPSPAKPARGRPRKAQKQEGVS